MSRRVRNRRIKNRRGGRVRKMHTGGFTYEEKLVSHGYNPNQYPFNQITGSSFALRQTAQTLMHPAFGPTGSLGHYGDMDFNTAVDIGDIVILIDTILNSTGGGGNRTQLMNIRQQLQTNPTPQVVNRARQMVNRMNGSTSMRMNRRNTTSYRRGGNVRRMQTGGRNSCGPGMVFRNGGCVPTMRRGGRPARRMPHGGPHNGGRSVFCPQGNYGFDEYGNQVCI